jgi:methionyl-tRNA synthetase
MTKPFYITTPLYYVNAKPHIGHAYTNILCDTFARWNRLIGREVFFMTGTDEHGTKIDKAAREQGKESKVYADEMMPEFKKLWQILGIEYDYFIRTTDANHKQVVQDILRDLEKKGDLYKGTYTGWYCTPCESFWTELQLVEGKCPDCKRDVQKLSEDNYFFKLSKYQDWLIQYIKDNPSFIRPEIRRNEILGFLNEPLEDLCITRPKSRLSWGIDYPGSKDHVVYVWFDALVNYISATKFPEISKKYPNLWPADVHMVGKDILRHHAVYWPIMLKAMDVQMPRTILAHGWWTMSGAKVSKSRGNTVDPVELCQKYGVDAFRYFLLGEVTLGLDGAFSEDLLAERYTTHLANDIGNLWFRIVTMLQKYTEGKIPKFKYDPKYNFPFGVVNKYMNGYDPARALNIALNIVVLANQKIEIEKPWQLAKDETKKEKLADVLGNLAEQMAHVGILLIPFLPETASKILTRLKLPIKWVIKDDKEFEKPLLKPGIMVERGEALFPRLDEEKAAK